MKQVSLHDIISYTVEVLLGVWGGRQGRLLGLDMQHIDESLKDFYCRSLNLDSTIFDAVLQALPDEWEQYKTAYSFYIVYGKK